MYQCCIKFQADVHINTDINFLESDSSVPVKYANLSRGEQIASDCHPPITAAMNSSTLPGKSYT